MVEYFSAAVWGRLKPARGFSPAIFLLALPLLSQERAAYDVNNRITALLSAADDLPLSTSVVAVLPTNKRVPLRPERNSFELPDGSKGTLEITHTEDAAGVHYTTAITTDRPLEVNAIELAIDLPRAVFLN